MTELLPVIEQSAASHPSPALTERLTSFVEKNKKAVTVAAITAGVVAAGGLGYYYYTSKPSKPSDAKTAEPRKKSKKSKKSKGSKPKSASPPAASDNDSKAASESESKEVPAAEADSLDLSVAQIQALEPSRRKNLATELKSKGNKAYSHKDYKKAISFYTKAIECEPQAVFYSNRAACYTNLQDNDRVIADCTDALRLDPSYIKALNRRGGAREAKGSIDDLFGALCDFTAAAILDHFQTTATAQSVDRVMKSLSEKEAAETLQKREPTLPSVMFIRAYMAAFRSKPLPEIGDDAQQGDKTLLLSLQANEAGDYAHAMSYANEAIEQGLSTDHLRALAHNVRGTFRFIMGNPRGALEDLDLATTLDPNYAQSWIKKASVHMELGLTEQAFEDFVTAEQVDPKDPDTFYHRGQVYFILGKFQEAIAEYRKSTELDGKFIYSQIQHGVSLYKDDKREKGLAKMQKLVKTFSDSPEVHNYYGELLLAQAEHDASYFEKAIASFDKAIELEDAKASQASVLPMINKALGLFQSNRARIGEAEEICRAALVKDPLCDVGIATLAQLYIQQNKINEAVEMFQRSVELARTEPELVHVLQYLNATKAQIKFVEHYPQEAQKLGVFPPSV